MILTHNKMLSITSTFQQNIGTRVVWTVNYQKIQAKTDGIVKKSSKL
jgi:hypothetical protein